MKPSILIIGTGSIALRHVENLLKICSKNVDIHVFSKNSNRSKVFAKKYKINYLSNLSSFEINNKKFTHLIIASNTKSHSIYLKKFYKLIKNIYCEKPIPHDENFNFLKNISINKKINNNIKIGFQWRFNPTVKFVKKYVSKNIKNIYQIDLNIGQNLKQWRKNYNYKNLKYAGNSKFSGVHWELCHELDILNFIFSKKIQIKSVLNTSNRLSVKVIDIANTISNSTYEKIIFRISQNMLSPHLMHNIIIYSMKEILEFDLINNIYFIKKKSNVKKVLIKKNFNRNQMFFNYMKKFIKNSSKVKNFDFASLKDGIKVTEQILKMEKKI